MFFVISFAPLCKNSIALSFQTVTRRVENLRLHGSLLTTRCFHNFLQDLQADSPFYPSKMVCKCCQCCTSFTALSHHKPFIDSFSFSFDILIAIYIALSTDPICSLFKGWAVSHKNIFVLWALFSLEKITFNSLAKYQGQMAPLDLFAKM